jgi:hypothetical protein
MIHVTTIKPISTHILWNEAKRRANLDKYGLDFTDAVMVLDSPYRLDVESVRGGGHLSRGIGGGSGSNRSEASQKNATLTPMSP